MRARAHGAAQEKRANDIGLTLYLTCERLHNAKRPTSLHTVNSMLGQCQELETRAPRAVAYFDNASAGVR